jgi:hypothetical protein
MSRDIIHLKQLVLDAVSNITDADTLDAIIKTVNSKQPEINATFSLQSADGKITYEVLVDNNGKAEKNYGWLTVDVGTEEKLDWDNPSFLCACAAQGTCNLEMKEGDIKLNDEQDKIAIAILRRAIDLDWL